MGVIRGGWVPRALALGALLGGLALSGAATAFAAPRLESTAAGVRWHGATLAGRGAEARAPVVAWWREARDPGLEGTAVLVPLADTLAARGDTLRADSLLSLPRLARSLWAWDALRRRAAYAIARGDRTAAGRLLDAADRHGWTASEDASWRALLAPILVAAGDTLAGQSLARQVLEENVSVTPASGQALELLESIARARREPFAPRLARRAALAEWANGSRAQALARLAQVASEASESERGADQLQRVQWLRDWRRYAAAVEASDTAVQWTEGTSDFDRARLERARSLRAAGHSDAAIVLYARVGGSAEDAAMRALAWWEYAREAQDESRWALAAHGFRMADSLAKHAPGVRSTIQSAGSLAGLMEWTIHRDTEAIQAWRESGDRRARFWLGVALRQRGEPEGDRILREEFAQRPGFDLYAVAARDTLDLPSWPGQVWTAQDDTIEPELVTAVVTLAGPLALPDAAARIVTARDHGDIRLPQGPKRGIAPTSWRAIAAASYAGGDLDEATRAADRALTAAPNDTSTWSWVPWAFPPAFEREVNSAAARMGVERELLWGLVRQESRFDPRAISRSHALGLAQLLPGTARDVARALGERLGSDTLLFEPGRALRYGAYYLRQLLDRFESVAPVALTAYNAGPGKVRADWRVLIARGGWALYCEMAANADTQDYVRRILGYRQAYRDLKPATADGP